MLCDWSTTAWSVQSIWNFTRIKSILRPIASNKKIIVSYFLWLDIAGSIFGNYAVVLQVLKRHHFQILTLLDILYIKIDLLITSNCVLQKFLESDITSKSYGLSKFWTVLLVDQYFFCPNPIILYIKTRLLFLSSLNLMELFKSNSFWTYGSSSSISYLNITKCSKVD